MIVCALPLNKKGALLRQHQQGDLAQASQQMLNVRTGIGRCSSAVQCAVCLVLWCLPSIILPACHQAPSHCGVYDDGDGQGLLVRLVLVCV